MLLFTQKSQSFQRHPRLVLLGCQDCRHYSKDVRRAALLAASCCVCPSCRLNRDTTQAERRVVSEVFGGGKRPSQNFSPMLQEEVCAGPRLCLSHYPSKSLLRSRTVVTHWDAYVPLLISVSQPNLSGSQVFIWLNACAPEDRLSWGI